MKMPPGTAKPSFDLHAQYALFTYSQCGDLDPFTVCDHFARLQAECIIGRESHQDGGTHLHVFADFGFKRRFRGSRTFDVQGFHPNLIPSRGTPWGGYDYAIKDGDVVAGGLARPEGNSSGVLGESNCWDHIVASSTRDEFWERLRIHAPKSLCTSWVSLSKYAEWRYADKPLEYESPAGDFTVMPELSNWVETNLYRIDGTNKPGKQILLHASSLRSSAGRGHPRTYA